MHHVGRDCKLTSCELHRTSFAPCLVQGARKGPYSGRQLLTRLPWAGPVPDAELPPLSASAGSTGSSATTDPVPPSLGRDALVQHATLKVRGRCARRGVRAEVVGGELLLACAGTMGMHTCPHAYGPPSLRSPTGVCAGMARGRPLPACVPGRRLSEVRLG